jgi:hypothetical protein
MDSILNVNLWQVDHSKSRMKVSLSGFWTAFRRITSTVGAAAPSPEVRHISQMLTFFATIEV